MTKSVTLSLHALLPMMGFFTLVYCAQFAFLPAGYAVSAWLEESVGIAFVILVSVRPMPQAWRWVASLCIAPLLNLLAMFVTVGTAAKIGRLDDPTAPMLAAAAFLGFVLFVGSLNLLVLERAFPWKQLHWYFWLALVSAVPAFAAVPGAIFFHKLVWFWSLVTVLYVVLRRSVADIDQPSGARRNWV